MGKYVRANGFPVSCVGLKIHNDREILSLQVRCKGCAATVWIDTGHTTLLKAGELTKGTFPNLGAEGIPAEVQLFFGKLPLSL